MKLKTIDENEKQILKNISMRIKIKRMLLGKSGEEVAKHLSIGDSTYLIKEKNPQKFKTLELIKLSIILNIEIEELLSIKNDDFFNNKTSLKENKMEE